MALSTPDKIRTLQRKLYTKAKQSAHACSLTLPACSRVLAQGELPPELRKRAREKLDLINQARVLEDLRIPQANRLEALKADRLGQHSIRINDQWRVCFQWEDGDAYDIEITDYH